MTDEVFRIVVAVAVGIACLGAVALVIVAILLLRALRAMQLKIEPLVDRAKPVIEQVPPMIDRVETTLRKAAPVIEKAGPVIDKIGPVVDRIGPMIDHIVPVADQAAKLLANTNEMVTETRPKFVEITAEVNDIAKLAREQVERVGDLLRDAGDRAHTRLEQIDRTVEHTVGQVEQVGDVVKRAVMSPVREVNGLAAGISAAVSSLVRGPRRPSVDEATQDEEMFI